MADRIITAEVRIDAQDHTGQAFAAIGKKIDNLGKAAKSSAGVDQLAKSLERAQAQMKAIDALQSKREAFGAARAKFREAQVAVEQAARAMRTAGGATKALQADYDRARGAVSRASVEFEKHKVAVIGAKRALEGFGVPIGRMVSEQKRLRMAIGETTREMERQARRGRQAEPVVVPSGRRRAGHGGAHGGDGTVGGLIGLAVAHGAAHAAHRVVETYGEFDRESRYAQVVMGLSSAQMEPLVAQAIHGAATSKFNDVQWLESQRELAARGYNREQVMGFAPVAAQLGQAFEVSMPEGVKLLEGALLGFKKDTSSRAAAAASAQRTADLQVKAGKISGMTAEDVQALYKYAASPAQMAGLSEEQMLAFGAIAKKANMGGDESGVAVRALGKNLLTPTQGAQVAMRAAGVDYSAYQKMPDSLNTAGFVDMVARQYGVKLDPKAQDSINRIFHDRGMIGNASAFMPAMLAVLNDTLGGDDAKSKHKIASLASRYRDASSLGVDTNALMTAVMTAMSKNPALANSIFGSKQGGRIFTALGDPKFFAHILDELQHQSQGFAQKVSDARMDGFYANLGKLSNSLMNVDTALGRAFDANGAGGALSAATGGVAAFAQRLAEADPIILRTGTEFAAAAAAVAGLKGLNLVQEVLGGLKNIGKGALVLEAGALEASMATGALTIAGGVSVATMAITGVAAVALIDFLSHGEKPKRKSDDPNFGKVPSMEMPTIPDAVPAKPTYPGRAAPFKNKMLEPHHWGMDRTGKPVLIPDPPLRPINFGPNGAPVFARGMYDTIHMPLTAIAREPMGKVPMMINAPPLSRATTTFAPVPVDVHSQTDVNVRVKVDVPPGFTATQQSQTTVTRSGKTMPSALKASNSSLYGDYER